MVANRKFVMPARQDGCWRTAGVSVKAVEEDGVFEGYASLFEREDMARDVIQRGAFRQSLARRRSAGIKMLFQHNPSEPIGVWETIREDGRGLFVRGRLMTSLARARDVLNLMRAGALDGLSIGFKAVKGRRDSRSGIRRLEAVDLWEISVVTFPMLPDARVGSVKSRPFKEQMPTQRQMERWLTRDAGLTRMEARAVLADGYTGLSSLRDARAGFSSNEVLAGRIKRLTERLRQAS